MTSLTRETPIGDISPYTYRNRNDQAKEVILTPVDAGTVGGDASYPPPQFDIEDLSSWMRQRYFFFEESVIAQVPRRSGDFPLRCNDAHLTDVTHDSDAGALHFYYPVTTEKAVGLVWQYRVDDWNIDLVDQPSDEEQICISEGHAAGTEAAWSWRDRP